MVDTPSNLKKLRAAYTKINGKVRKIIDAFVEAGFASFTTTQIRNITGNNNETIANFTHWDEVQDSREDSWWQVQPAIRDYRVPGIIVEEYHRRI